MDAIEDTGFEAHLMGVTDSRSLTLQLEDWPLPPAQQDVLRAALSGTFGVLQVTLQDADGTVEVALASLQLYMHKKCLKSCFV